MDLSPDNFLKEAELEAYTAFLTLPCHFVPMEEWTDETTEAERSTAFYHAVEHEPVPTLIRVDTISNIRPYGKDKTILDGRFSFLVAMKFDDVRKRILKAEVQRHRLCHAPQEKIVAAIDKLVDHEHE